MTDAEHIAMRHGITIGILSGGPAVGMIMFACMLLVDAEHEKKMERLQGEIIARGHAHEVTTMDGKKAFMWKEVSDDQ